MLKIENVQKNYPGFRLDVSMEVKPGRITGLIGQNGAGKSTLFKAILQLIHTDGGRIELFGEASRALTENDKRRIGTVLADSGFSGYLTVKDVRKIMTSFYPDFVEDEFQRRCLEAGLTDSKKVKELSTGMKAKLKVLAAISHRAELLILDEPTAGLDVIAREEVLDMLRGYLEEDECRAILISSHISTDLETLCDDFYMIHDGKIVLHEETDRLLSEYAILKVTADEYEAMDKQYLLRKKKEAYGYSLLTDQSGFYRENYPQAVIEKSGLDELILLMVKGEEL